MRSGCRRDMTALDESAEGAPVFASLIFHSLAARYAEVLERVALHSGKRLRRVFVVGGGSKNNFLNRLTRGGYGAGGSAGIDGEFDGGELCGADGGAGGQPG